MNSIIGIPEIRVQVMMSLIRVQLYVWQDVHLYIWQDVHLYGGALVCLAGCALVCMAGCALVCVAGCALVCMAGCAGVWTQLHVLPSHPRPCQPQGFPLINANNHNISY